MPIPSAWSRWTRRSPRSRRRAADRPFVGRITTLRRRMQVTQLSDAVMRPRRVAVGEFDGVHLGHRAVIAGNDTVLTFEPHPAVVVKPAFAPKLLTSLEVKIELLAAIG